MAFFFLGGFHLINRLCKHSANQNPGQCSLVSHKTASQTQTRGFYAEILIWGKWSKPRQHGPSGDGEGLTYIFINPSLPPPEPVKDEITTKGEMLNIIPLRCKLVEGVESETNPLTGHLGEKHKLLLQGEILNCLSCLEKVWFWHTQDGFAPSTCFLLVQEQLVCVLIIQILMKFIQRRGEVDFFLPTILIALGKRL